jgi:hypothetical protein
MPINFNAIDAGIASENSARLNAAALRRLVDEIQTAGGGTIIIPPGTYAIDGTIALNPPVGSSIDIRGRDGARLVQTAGPEIPLFSVGTEDEECGNIVIANLHIEGAP